jgi:iron complex outermembrane receptor protein
MKELYSTTFQQRLPNPELKPERSRNWNIGYTYVFAARTVAQLEYFHNAMRDAINDVYVPDPGDKCPESDNPGYCEQWANVTKEVHEGFELSLRSTPVRVLTVDASYSYLNRTVEYDPDVLRLDPQYLILPTVPRNKVVLTATTQLPHAILGLFTYRYEGGLQVQDTTWDSRNYPLGVNDPEYLALIRPFAESHHVVDIGAVVPIAKGLSAQTGIKNLFDTNYFYTPGYPEAGRNWYFNLRHRF